MPLTQPDPPLSYKGLQCACWSEFFSHAAYYAHVGECPILRCCYCLEWLHSKKAEEQHVCPKRGQTRV